MREVFTWVLFVVALFFSFGANGTAAAEIPVDNDQVVAAIERGASYLKSTQRQDGSWPYEKREHVQGATALAVLALSEAGVPADDPTIVKGLQYVLSKPFSETYNAGCAAMAFVSVDPGRYIKGLAAARDYIVSAQNARGMWSYRLGDPLRRVGDNSNSQFAVLGLRAAMSVGLSVPEETLKLAERHYATSQNADGGWGYSPGGNSYGSMTAAGVASLYILGGRLYVESGICGQYRQDPRVAAGFRWLVNKYTMTTNPSSGPKWVYYYLYALERVGVLTGLKTIGPHDWYIDGCHFILAQQNADGSWLSGRDRIPNTCFAILFLSKGNVPVLINKLVHGGDWNVDVHDAENLSSYVSRLFNQRVGWQTVSLSDSTATLLSAPILYVTGHSWGELSVDEKAKLADFFERGGLMFAEACCAKKEFDAPFRKAIAELFPDARLQRFERGHGIYNSWFKLSRSSRYLEGLAAGCRTSIIYSPKDLSCAWEKGDLKTDEEAFKFGANIVAYATGRERLKPKLRQRLEGVKAKITSAAAGAFTLAQVMYAGGWNPHPASGEKLLAFLNEEAGLAVSSGQVSLPLTDPNLANYPFIYMTGMKRFFLGDEEKKALKGYVERGGFLFADASAGKAEFDESFRALMSEIFASSPLLEIPPDSPVFTIAFDVKKVRYTAAVRETNPQLEDLKLYGVRIGGRIGVVYSPYDIGCALTGFPTYGSRGLSTDDAFKAAANIVLFALTY